MQDSSVFNTDSFENVYVCWDLGCKEYCSLVGSSHIFAKRIFKIFYRASDYSKTIARKQLFFFIWSLFFSSLLLLIGFGENSLSCNTPYFRILTFWDCSVIYYLICLILFHNSRLIIIELNKVSHSEWLQTSSESLKCVYFLKSTYSKLLLIFLKNYLIGFDNFFIVILVTTAPILDFRDSLIVSPFFQYFR